MAIANADGSIVLTTEIDTSGVQQGSNSIKNVLQKIGNSAKSMGMKIQNSFSAFKMQGLTIGKLNQAIEEQEYLLEKLNARYATFVAMGRADTAEAKNLKLEIKDLTAELAELNKARETLSKNTNKDIKSTSSGIQKIGKRIAGLAKRVFIFSVILKALRGILDTFKGILLSDKAFRKDWEELKAALYTAFQPLVKIFVPAIMFLLGAAKELAIAFGHLMAAISGKSYEDLVNSAKATKQMADNYGTMADESDETAKNVKKQLADFDDISVLNFGNDDEDYSGFDGLLSKSLEMFKGIDFGNMTKGLSAVVQGFKDFVNVAWEDVQWAFKEVITPIAKMIIEDALPNFFEKLGDRLSNLGEILKKISPLVRDFWSKFLQPIIANLTETFLETWDELNEEFDNFEKNLSESEVWEDLKTTLSELYPVILDVVNAIISLIDWVAKITNEQVFNDLNTMLSDLEDSLGAVAAIMNGDFTDAFVHIRKLLIDNRIKDAVDDLKMLKNAIVNASKNIKEFFVDFTTTLKDMLKRWAYGISDWWNSDVKPWFTVEKWEGILQNIVNAFANIWNNVYDFFTRKMPEWWDTKIAPWFTKERWLSLWQGAKEGIKLGWQSIKDFFQKSIPEWWNSQVVVWFTIEKWKELGNNVKKGIVNPIIEALNWLIDKLNEFSIEIPEIKGITQGYTFGFNISKIPALAKGAVLPANKPFLAMVGDQKYGTNIETPLSTMVEAFQMALDSRGTNDTVKEEHYYLSENEIMRIIYKLAKRGEQAQGENLLESW